ncbi:MAG: ParB/RepB/Spo0J family partition protein [Actinobacteria bacterium]|nr:ParB/RepB/Spo0J family partition protein [Actinomycetota bacterium]
MSEKRRGLGRGLGALIPNTTGTKTAGDRPVDVFFPGKTESPPAVVPEARATPNGETPGTDAAAPTGAPDAAAAPANGVATYSAASAVVDLDAATGSATGPAGTGELLPVPGARFAELPVMSIRPNPRQPRQVFDEEALAELVHSVKEIGVLQPVVVREAASEDGEARYELIMGERRWRATQEAGLETIPAIVRETSDDVLLRDALLENLHRSQLNPLEEAAAYQQLLDDFGCTHEELATRIGRSRPQISNTIRLLRLPPLVQRRVAAGVLSAGHARALLGLDDAAAMERLAQRIVAEGLSVRMVEEIVALGDGPVAKPAKKRPRAGGHTSELNDLASRLGDRLDTKVSVALGRSKGRLSIDFASVEDLNRIIGLMSPEVKGVFQEVR